MHGLDKYIILLIVLLIMPVVFSIDYTSNTDTICTNNICTKTIYSFNKYIYEEGEWKNYKEAKSLKDKGFNIRYLEKEKLFDLNIIDFNYTSITVELLETEIGKPIPIRTWNINPNKSDNISKVEIYNNIESYKNTSVLTKENEITFKTGDKNKIQTLEFGFDKIIEYGYNSTTIMLSIADSENLDDTNSRNSTPDTPVDAVNLQFGTNGGSNEMVTYIKFNISSIPTGVNIINSSLGFYIITNDIINGEQVGLYHVYSNVSWDESTLTWNNQPCGNMTNYTNCNITPYYNLTVADFPVGTSTNITTTNIINYSYNIGEPNVSIAIKLNENVSTNGKIIVDSKESFSVDDIPKLFITYETPTIPEEVRTSSEISKDMIYVAFGLISLMSIIAVFSIMMLMLGGTIDPGMIISLVVGIITLCVVLFVGFVIVYNVEILI